MTLHQSAGATTTTTVMLSLVLLLSLTISSVTAQTGACLGSFDAITLRENLFAGSYETTREYILCPNTVVNVGRLDFSNKLIPGSGQDFLPARANLIVKCGESGSRANNCVVLGGDVQIDATSFLGLVLQPTNVRFEGITFGASRRYTLWATQPGDITFVDCVFRDNTVAMAPIYLDYFDAAQPDSTLQVSFQRCEFTLNRYFGEGSNTAIITANGKQNQLSFDMCHFKDNDYTFNNTKVDTNSFLIETSGPIAVRRSCFQNNVVGVSPVVAYASEVVSEMNYGFFSGGQTCQFISSFQTTNEYRLFLPRCSSFDTGILCLADETGAPSVSPTAPPTKVGSDVPTGIPSAMPSATPTTSSPSTSPSFAPSMTPSTPHPTTTTGFPSLSPSDAPTTLPTSTPTGTPSDMPSGTPTITSTGAPTPAPVAGPGPGPGPAAPSSGPMVRQSVVAILATVCFGWCLAML